MTKFTTDDGRTFTYGKSLPRTYDEDVKRLVFEMCRSYRGRDEHPPGICPTCNSWLDAVQDLKDGALEEELL